MTVAHRLDMREVPPAERHPLVFSTFDALPRGESFDLVVDHDPVPLYFQLDRARPGQFYWLYLEAGPKQWHVRIARVADGVPPG